MNYLLAYLLAGFLIYWTAGQRGHTWSEIAWEFFAAVLWPLTIIAGLVDAGWTALRERRRIRS